MKYKNLIYCSVIFVYKCYDSIVLYLYVDFNLYCYIDLINVISYNIYYNL